MREAALRLAIGVVRPSRATRSPARTSISAIANVSTSARSRLLMGAKWLLKSIEGETSGQSQKVCEASHSRSRTYSVSELADRRQSMTVAGSLPWNWRNCQKVSPVPARRRPWMPCTTVLATRSASSSKSGSRSASACASPSSLKTLALPLPCAAAGPLAATRVAPTPALLPAG